MLHNGDLEVTELSGTLHSCISSMLKTLHTYIVSNNSVLEFLMLERAKNGPPGKSNAHSHNYTTYI